MRSFYRRAGRGLALISVAAAALLSAAAPAAVQVDRAFMVGRWSDTGTCTDASALNRDGTFTATNGSRGYWHYQGGRLTLTGTSTLQLGIQALDRNKLKVINPDGSIGQSTRCRGGDRAARLPLDRTRLDAAYLTGRWTDTTCDAAVSFLAGGEFRTGAGASGRWTLSGDRVTLAAASTLVLQIVPVDKNRMLVVNPGGNLGYSTRC